MTEISDVMEFAVRNPDYWQELFSGDTLPEELTEEEGAAVQAAVNHIQQLTVELLHASAASFATKVGIPRKRHWESATLKHRAVWLPAPEAMTDRLYDVWFGLEHNRSAGRIDLYGSLTVKKRGPIDEFRAALDKVGIEHDVDDYSIFPPYIKLSKGGSVDLLAEQAADATLRMFEVLRRL